jgi:hypothetical protein
LKIGVRERRAGKWILRHQGVQNKIFTRIMGYGLWTMDYGLWTMDYGLWTMDYGLWTMDYGSFIFLAISVFFLHYSLFIIHLTREDERRVGFGREIWRGV